MRSGPIRLSSAPKALVCNGWKNVGKSGGYKGVPVKTTCPKCQASYDISDKEILAHIERSPRLRAKVAALLGRLTGGQTKLDAEGRRQRALKAVQAREAKRNNE
jgi:hypothetical protein